MIHRNKPLGALIYAFQYAYQFTLGTINALKMDSIYSENGLDSIDSPILNLIEISTIAILIKVTIAT